MQPSHEGFRRLPLKLWTAIHVFQMLPEADILSRLFNQESFSKLSRSNQRPTKKSKPYAVPWAKSKDISMVWNDWNGAQTEPPAPRCKLLCLSWSCSPPNTPTPICAFKNTFYRSKLNNKPQSQFLIGFYSWLYQHIPTIPLVFRMSISWWPLTPPPRGGGLETTMGHPALRWRWRFGCLCIMGH